MKKPMKGGLAIFLASKKGKKDEDTEDMMDEEEDEDELDVAAEEVLEAIKSEDIAALKEALLSFHQMCSSEDSEDY